MNKSKVIVAGVVVEIFSIFYLLLLPLSSLARELSREEVKEAVKTWVRYVTAAARPDAIIERMEPYQVDGETVAYIAHLREKGFCICGAADLVLPVYLYNPEGTYDQSNPSYQYILWEIATRTKKLTKAVEEKAIVLQPYQRILAERASFWQELIAGRIPEKVERAAPLLVEPDTMSLNLNSQWRQGSPYNDQCPELTPNADEHTVVGCNATAMSQIMYYWEWPNTGAGSDDVDYYYYWTDTQYEEPLAFNPNPNIFPGFWGGFNRLEWTPANGGRLRMDGYWDNSLYSAAWNEITDNQDYRNALGALWTSMVKQEEIVNCPANFGATSYNWSIIGDRHTDPPGAGDAEVAKLCHHVGIAINMNYGIRGSAASMSNWQGALPGYFRYYQDVVYEIKDANTINKMTEEIQWLRPLGLRGSGPSGIHGWVVYGYNKGTDPDREFLMNMGWGPGSDHVWYSLDSVDLPFPDNHYHATHIAPKDVVKFVGDDNPGDGSPDDPYEDIEEAIADKADIPNGATLIFKAGSGNTFAANSIVIDFPVTLKAEDATIRKQ